jgi:hypothetical protein
MYTLFLHNINMYIKILYLKKHRTHYNYLFINVKLRKNEYLCHMAHLAGDGSFREKTFKEFCQFRNNQLIYKISYKLDFENV